MLDIIDEVVKLRELSEAKQCVLRLIGMGYLDR